MTMIEGSSENSKAAGMCPHMNFPSTCSKCHAEKKDDVKTDVLVENEKKLALRSDVEFNEHDEGSIAKARILIANKDHGGEKIKMFEEALDYYLQPQEILAETPIYHSTGSYGLAKILEHGAVESKKNIATGEQAATGEEIDTTSFVIGGYDQSETVSYFYAKKNERTPKLILDKRDVTGVGCEEDMVNTIFKELPTLTDNERVQVASAVQRLKGDREISDEELMTEKMRGLQERKYYFDPEKAKAKLVDLQNDLEKIRQGGDQWEILQKIAKVENGLTTYNEESSDMKLEMTDPFPVILMYEGKDLPEEDLTNLTSGLVSERRTRQPIKNSQLKQIQVPKNEMGKVRQWLGLKMDSLPIDSTERKSLSKVKVIPLEFFEAKMIILEKRND